MRIICSCIKCKGEFSTKGINTHFLRRHDGKSFTKFEELRCELCDKILFSKQALVGHMQRSHYGRANQVKLGILGNKILQEKAAAGELVLGSPHTEETKQRLSIIACERLAKHSKYSKNVEYKPGVILESSYEVRVAKILDELYINWEKVRKGYIWDDNGKQRRYIPDFYLPKYDLFLDPKNDFLIKKDRIKIDSAMQLNNIRVVVLSDKEINRDFIKSILL